MTPRLFLRMTRAFGSSTVYVGPLATRAECAAWCEEHGTQAAIICPLDPSSSYDELWAGSGQDIMSDDEWGPE